MAAPTSTCQARAAAMSFASILALQTTQRVRPDDPLARGVLDVPAWLVVVVAVVLVIGTVLALLHRARKR